MHTKFHHFDFNLIFFLFWINFTIPPNIDKLVLAAETPNIRASATEIENALKSGNLLQVSQYLDSADRINRHYEWGFPLCIAVTYQQVGVVDYLLENGGETDTYSLLEKLGVEEPWNYLTPLELAVKSNNLEIIGLLVKKGAKPDYKVMDLVMDRDSLTIMKVFIENGVKVDYSHIYHAKTQNNLDLLQYLIINTEDPFGPSGVARDAIIGVKNIETAKLLIKLGADVHVKGEDNTIALHHIFQLYDEINQQKNQNALELKKASNLDVAKLLVSMGLDVNATDRWGNTPLHFDWGAADTPTNLEIVAYFLESGAAVNAANEEGDTPLHAMANHCNLNLAKLLLREGAEVNAKNKKSDSPLHATAFRGDSGIEVAKLLLANGADINASNQSGWTPLDVALENVLPGMADFLKKQGAKSNAEEDFYVHQSFFDKHVELFNGIIIYGTLSLFFLSGCFAVYGIARLIFAKKEERSKYSLIIVLSIIGFIVFYSFLKMIGEALAI